MKIYMDIGHMKTVRTVNITKATKIDPHNIRLDCTGVGDSKLELTITVGEAKRIALTAGVIS